MFGRRAALVVTLPLATLLAAAGFGASSFLGAPAGSPVPSEVVPLPMVRPAPGFDHAGGWAPSPTQLLQGNTIIRTEPQMRYVWRVLFNVPYDASLFDFSEDFVVLMGGGQLRGGSFSISAVEQVDADWATLFFPGPATDRFLAVTATTVLPGILRFPEPPLTWRVSAVRVSNAFADDAVFHRAVVALP